MQWSQFTLFNHRFFKKQRISQSISCENKELRTDNKANHRVQQLVVFLESCAIQLFTTLNAKVFLAFKHDVKFFIYLSIKQISYLFRDQVLRLDNWKKIKSIILALSVQKGIFYIDVKPKEKN